MKRILACTLLILFIFTGCGRTYYTYEDLENVHEVSYEIVSNDEKRTIYTVPVHVGKVTVMSPRSRTEYILVGKRKNDGLEIKFRTNYDCYNSLKNCSDFTLAEGEYNNKVEYYYDGRQIYIISAGE